MENLFVRLARVNRTTLVEAYRTPGFVTYIEPTQHVRVQAPFAAQDRDVVRAANPTQWVPSGKPLMTPGSEALLAAERGHVALLQESLTPEESRGRCRDSGFRRGHPRLEKKRAPSSKLTLYAPYPGLITNLRVAAGDSVNGGSALFELSGMARASVLANAFQRDAAWIQTGQAVEVSFPTPRASCRPAW